MIDKQLKYLSRLSAEWNKNWDRDYATIPASLYIDISNNDILVKSFKQPYRSNYMKRFHNNIDIIKKMLFEENKSVIYAAKWIRISYLVFMRLLKNYIEQNQTIRKRIDKGYYKKQKEWVILDFLLECTLLLIKEDE